MFSNETYFLTAKDILKQYGFMTAKKLTYFVNKELGTELTTKSLVRYIVIYNDGTVKKSSKRTWEYVE